MEKKRVTFKFQEQYEIHRTFRALKQLILLYIIFFAWVDLGRWSIIFIKSTSEAANETSLTLSSSWPLSALSLSHTSMAASPPSQTDELNIQHPLFPN